MNTLDMTSPSDASSSDLQPDLAAARVESVAHLPQCVLPGLVEDQFSNWNETRLRAIGPGPPPVRNQPPILG